ncbi:E3 ubiquitin-protein ligase [Forsythia ovata]|uniref:E3 ubiquitin-protein ligase n=1 Tax=Forsythia ovata TaxID=205694 RepID=A0ABD1T8W2_9LAMI
MAMNGGVPTVNHFVHNQDQPNRSYTTERAKKSGKANACSGKIFVTVPLNHFGLIIAEHDPERNLGMLVGETWEDMMECRQWGTHFTHIAGIAGQSQYGAQSVALSGSYEDDDDHGEWFLLLEVSSASDAITSEMESARFRLYHKEAPVYD